MKVSDQHLEALHDIRQMMEKSSRFISLSGWSGISAGICALVGAHFANQVLQHTTYVERNSRYDNISADRTADTLAALVSDKLFFIAVATFIAALFFAFIFTYTRSRRQNIPIWGTSSRRLLVNVMVPMLAGGIFIIKLLELGHFGLIAPACLIFYGLALINAGRYTLGEIKYLGYVQLALGLISCWAIGYGLYFWALGFGIMHIVYGALMLWKYERNTTSNS